MSCQSLMLRHDMHQQHSSAAQAMMELGACVCTGQPKCESCPVRTHCHAHAKLQDFVAAGGSLLSPDAPLVTNFPLKVPPPNCNASSFRLQASWVVTLWVSLIGVQGDVCSAQDD